MNAPRNSAATLKSVATGVATAEDAKNPLASFQNFMERRKDQLAAALPKHLTPERMIRLVLTEFTKTPALLQCEQKSIWSSIITASQLGLEIGVMGQAYLVPFNRRVRQGNEWVTVKECQMIPGYKGLLSLARRSGDVTSIETHIAYANDVFELELGINTKVRHVPRITGDRGEPLVVYGVAHFKDGGHHFEWMPVTEINAIRDKTFEKNRADEKAREKSPWGTDWGQMARKTLVRRMANYLPMSIELAAALELENTVDNGKRATIDASFMVIPEEGQATFEGDEGGPQPGGENDPPAGGAPGATTETPPPAEPVDGPKSEPAPAAQAPAAKAPSAPFTLADARALVERADYAGARDMVRSAPFTKLDQKAIETLIAEHIKASGGEGPDATGE